MAFKSASRTCAVLWEVLDSMLGGVQRVGAGVGYEVVEKQAAAAGRLRKKARVLARRTQPSRIRPSAV
jgi:hypothetical protein